MSKLIIDEQPLVLLPSLAKAIGLTEAVVLQQIHYWVSKKKHFYDQKYWTYNSYEGWQDQFSFLTPRQIQYAINNLEKCGLLISGNYNKLAIDRTKWYTINYEKLNEKLDGFSPTDKIACPPNKIVESIDASVKPSNTNVRAIPETTTKTTTEVNIYMLIEWIKENCPEVSKLKTQITPPECEKIITEFGIDKVKAKLLAMENRSVLLKKYKSVYLTLKEWLKRDKDNNNTRGNKAGTFQYKETAKEKKFPVTTIN